MKNNFLFGLAIATTLFISCGDDDIADIVINDNSITNNNKISHLHLGKPRKIT